MLRPSWGLTLVLALGAVLAGIVVGIEAKTLRSFYSAARYNVRETLGLEKNWAAVPGPAQADGRTAQGCPDPEQTFVVVTGGQSNAANMNPVLSHAGPGVSIWFDGRCFAAEDPMLGASGKGGSLWPLLADRLTQDLSRPVLLINGAIGGTQFGDWLDDRSGYYAALSGRIAAARVAGYEPDLILWHQGETDAAAEDNMQRLRTRMKALFDRLLDDMPDAQLYLFVATKCIGSKRADGVEAVRAIQEAVANENPRIILGMNTDALGDDYRWDTCHFNSWGRTVIVDTVAPVLGTLESSFSTDPQTARP